MAARGIEDDWTHPIPGTEHNNTKFTANITNYKTTVLTLLIAATTRITTTDSDSDDNTAPAPTSTPTQFREKKKEEKKLPSYRPNVH